MKYYWDEADAYNATSSMNDAIFTSTMSQFLSELAPLSGNGSGHFEKEIASLISCDYLAKSLTKEDKIACFINNNLFLCSLISPDALQEISFEHIIIYKNKLKDNIFSVSLKRIRNNILEGGLSLDFLFNGAQIYTASFTFIPGLVVGVGDSQCILVSRMQGVKGKYADIRQATKEQSEISPQAVLFAVIVGIAKATGIKHIIGTCGENQVCFEKGDSAVFYHAYDRFFLSVGGAALGNGFYAFELPLPEKPLSRIKRCHRSRTKLKREMKAEISRVTSISWQQKLMINGGAGT